MANLTRDNLMVISRDTNNPLSTTGTITSGRDLRLDDRGQRVTVVKLNPTLKRLGVQVGSTIGLRFNGQVYDFQVVGLLAEEETSGLQASMTMGDAAIPPDSVKASSQFQLNIAQIDPQHLNKALIELSALPLVYSFDITYIDGMLSRFIEQMSAIPILVGLLSLGAAAVIMANTVALATLERRRQIGVLKAVGLKGRRVLSVMLLENTMVSLLGGLIGIGLSALGVVIMSKLSLNLSLLVPTDSTPVAIALVIAAILIAWAATVLSARAVIGERVTNVLRYE
jgi:ABC-type antimicrobial peptide transport system permease subunit